MRWTRPLVVAISRFLSRGERKGSRALQQTYVFEQSFKVRHVSPDPDAPVAESASGLFPPVHDLLQDRGGPVDFYQGIRGRGCPNHAGLATRRLYGILLARVPKADEDASGLELCRVAQFAADRGQARLDLGRIDLLRSGFFLSHWYSFQ